MSESAFFAVFRNHDLLITIMSFNIDSIWPFVARGRQLWLNDHMARIRANYPEQFSRDKAGLLKSGDVRYALFIRDNWPDLLPIFAARIYDKIIYEDYEDFESPFISAFCYGHLEIAAIIRKVGKNFRIQHLISICVENNLIKSLLWVYATFKQQPIPHFSYHITEAASFGYLDIIKILDKNGCDHGFMAVQTAASAGHLHVVKWLYERKKVCSDVAFSNAIIHGHLEILKWLFENVNEIIIFPKNYYLSYGDDMAEWLPSKPVSEVNMDDNLVHAIEDDQVEIVRYLYEKANISRPCIEAIKAARDKPEILKVICPELLPEI